MKVLSIDVGIKNLAYCLIELTSLSEYKIINWNVVNLLDDQKKICMYNDGNKSCKCCAKFKKNNEYYCNKHSKMHEIFKIPPKDLNIIKLKRQKLFDILELAKKYDIHDNDKINKESLLKKNN